LVSVDIFKRLKLEIKSI